MRRLALILCLLAGPLWAVEPGEILDDPALEERARDLSKGLRCMVCRNESIDESNADLARDLRLLVRERLVAGDTDDEVIDFVTDRYGEYVLLRPTLTGSNLILWAAGPVLLLLAGGVAAVYLRRRASAVPEGGDLSEDEKRRLDEIMRS
ncbi:cytochrome c-type biogenesis protein CcmH [Rhodobacteraceae bacterium CCMM004]|nr:cytochrome c-type biogenesis protein CcmH [Rhodobacteraceae bacterium CCMM004]